MKKHVLLITSLFLLALAQGLYGESDDQPKWNTTLFGSYFLSQGSAFGIGGAVGYRFTPRLELEGEMYSIFGEEMVYSVSGGLLYNFDNGTKNSIRYVLGGFSQFIHPGGTTNSLMFGGGIKKYIAKYLKIRFDLRINMAENVWTKFSTGLMWTF